MFSGAYYVWMPECNLILNLLKNEEKHKLAEVPNGSYAIRIPDELKQSICAIAMTKCIKDCWVFVCFKHERFGKEIFTEYFITSEEKFKNYFLCPALGAYATPSKLTLRERVGEQNGGSVNGCCKVRLL